jgi:L-ascorbate metabolism protein UlaG (beta-lactamase superfamily)
MELMVTTTKLYLHHVKLIALASAFFLTGCSSSWTPHKLSLLSNTTYNNNQLNAKYLGVSNVYLSDGKTSLLIDGFLSRRGIFNALIYGMTTDKGAVDFYLKRANIFSLSAVLIAHPHYDHALDSKYIAEKMDTAVYGSSLSQKVTELAALKVVNDGDIRKIDSFKVTFIATPHIEKEGKVKFIEPLYLFLTRGWKYRHLDKNFSFFIEHDLGNVLIVPSANYIPRKFAGLRADVIFLSVGLLGSKSDDYIRQYWAETVAASNASLVIPIHWDNFSKPLVTDLKATPSSIDEIERTIEILSELADANPEVTLKFIAPFTNVNITSKR